MSDPTTDTAARRARRQAQAHRAAAQRILDPRAGDRAGAHRDPGRRRVGLAHAPRRGGRLHPRRDRGDEIKDRPTLTLNAGDPFLMPPRTPHNALDLGPDTGPMLSTYIVEVGESLASFTTG